MELEYSMRQNRSGVEKVLSLNFITILISGFAFSTYSFTNEKSPQFCPQKYKELFHFFAPQDPKTLPIKVGIEIEFSQPLKVGLDQTAELIRTNIAIRYPQVSVKYDSLVDTYEITYQKTNLEIKKWTVKTDRSIKTSQIPVEITSPILVDDDDFLQFRKIVSAVKNSKAKIEPQSGGIHVHVDFAHTDSAELATLAAVFSEIEYELKKIFSTHSSRMEYIEPTSQMLLKLIAENSFDQRDSRTPFIKDLLNAQGRRHALNLRSYSRFRTVEFRLFNSTFNLEALELMSDFSAKLVQGVRTQNQDLIEYLTQKNEKIELERIAAILKMKIAEPHAKNVLEKIFRESKSFGFGQKLGTQGILAERLVQILGVAAVIDLVIQKGLPSIVSESFMD